MILYPHVCRTGSQITKAWRAYMDDCEQTARQLKENAELLDTLCKEKLTQLHHDKQRARKAYQEEHSRLASQFHNVCTHTETVKSPLSRNEVCIILYMFCAAKRRRSTKEVGLPEELGLLQVAAIAIRRSLREM